MANITGPLGAVMSVLQGTAQVGGQNVNPAAVCLVDVNGNPITSTDLAPNAIYGGLMVAGNVSGITRNIRADMMGGQASASHAPVLVDQFEGTTVNPNRWGITTTTMTVAQSNVLGMVLNGGGITTVNTGALAVSHRKISIMGRHPVSLRFRSKVNVPINSSAHIGLGDGTTVTALPTNGAVWSITAGNLTIPQLIVAGAVVWSGSNTTLYLDSSKPYLFEIVKDDNALIFLIIDQQTNLIVDKQICQIPPAAGDYWQRSAMPVMFRLSNGATAPASAPAINIYDLVVTQADISSLFNAADAMGMSQRSSKLDPFTGARTSNIPVAGAEIATTLAGGTPAHNGLLDGRFSFAIPTASNQDQLLFAYQVPANATLVIKAITVDVIFQAGSGSQASLSWNSWFNCDTAGGISTAKAVANIGNMGFGTASAIGDQRRITKTFNATEVVHGGKFIITAVKSVVSASGGPTIAGNVDVDGYFI